MKNICSICNRSADNRIINEVETDSGTYDVYFCERCKVGFTLPVPSKEELSRLYSSGSYRSDKGRRFNPFIELLISVWRHQRERRIRKYKRSGRVLDIGCGRGLFLNIMKRSGWSVTGVEFDEERASQTSREYDIHVVYGEPGEWGFHDESFDVITISHVLEHLYRPAEIIGACGRLLPKGGLLVCSVPNISSLQASVGKGAWFHLDIPYHLHHFSERGLIRLLERYSFKILKIRRFDIEYNPFGWLQTLLNISGVRKNFLYSLLKNPRLRKNELAHSKKRDLLLTVVLLPFFLPLSFMLSLFESFLLKRGGAVEIFAIKE